MDKKVKAKWLKALRSGQYHQAKDSLVNYRGNAFCCLGVLCNLHAEATGGVWVDDKYGGETTYLGQRYELPLAVQKWAGLKSSCPMIDGQGLADLNDDGMRFKKIADLIEARL